MTRQGPRRTPGEQLAEAFDLANRLWPGKFWLFGKGRLAPAEPLYGFRVFDPHEPDHPIAESEHDDPYECVMRSIDTGRAGVVSISPAAPSARMLASERVANALDPEVGFPSDQLLRRIHADLEGRGRKNPAFAVSVHHRNIVLSAAAKALRSHEMPWNEWLEQCDAAAEQPADDVYRCPICDDAVRHGDVCATDIERAQSSGERAAHAWAEIAGHYRWAMLSAERLLDSIPIRAVERGPIGIDPQSAKISEASEGLRSARHDMIHKHGITFLNTGPLGPASTTPSRPQADDGWRPTGHVSIAHDGFAGDIIGHYETREGKRGVVVQQDGTRVVHVYGERWLLHSAPATGGGE